MTRVRINYTPINGTPPLQCKAPTRETGPSPEWAPQCNCMLRNQTPVELIHPRLTWEWMQYIAVACYVGS
jgi:hypothetical protein